MVLKSLHDFIVEKQKEFEKKRQEMVVARFKVPSKSVKGDFHLIEIYEDGVFTCDCVSAMYKKECRHIKIIRNYLKKNKAMYDEIQRRYKGKKLMRERKMTEPIVPLSLT